LIDPAVSFSGLGCAQELMGSSGKKSISKRISKNGQLAKKGNKTAVIRMKRIFLGKRTLNES
jgi:hypothetical protein